MRGEIRRWFRWFFAIGEIRHWQIPPVEFEAVSAERSIITAMAFAGEHACLFQRVQVVAHGLFALTGVARQLLH